MRILFLTFMLTALTMSTFGQTSDPKDILKPDPVTVAESSPSFLARQLGQADKSKPRYLFVYIDESITRVAGASKEDELTLEQVIETNLERFQNNLNEASRAGYRVVYSIPRLRAALMELDKGEYEYRLFTVESSFHFAKACAGNDLKAIIESGYKIIGQQAHPTSCNSPEPGQIPIGEDCTYKNTYLAEKELKGSGIRLQSVVSSYPKWGASPSEELSQLAQAGLVKGFFPQMAISKYEILLQELSDLNEADKDVDIKIVRQRWGSSGFQKNINTLAKQGYMLIDIIHGMAVLYKNNDTANSSVKYTWIRADKKDFDKKLVDAQRKGWNYSMFYPDQNGERQTLIFEENLKQKNTPSEFRIFDLEFEKTEDGSKSKEITKLTEASEKTLEEINDLSKKGFTVKDLIYVNGIKIILESEKSFR